jgi:hypothetical protein
VKLKNEGTVYVVKEVE